MARINLDEPRWPQDTFGGRLRHFSATVNPLNVLATSQQLGAAKNLVDTIREGGGYLPDGVTEDEAWAAKQLYDSSFHPETGEKQILLGRMSFQMPGNTIISGCMIYFRHTVPQIMFFQWVNQTFNAVVNYTNRNASAGITNQQLATCYVSATGAAWTVALGLNRLVARSPRLQAGLVGRLVPFFAVASSSALNVPLMRQRELADGINLHREQTLKDEPLVQSQAAAKRASFAVVLARIGMAIPPMVGTPLAMQTVEKTSLFIKNPVLALPATLGFYSVFVGISTPITCAAVPQTMGIATTSLPENESSKLVTVLKARSQDMPKTLYYNKGL